MKAPGVIASIIRRYLKGADGFHLAGASDSLPVEIAVRPDELVVGWYQNPPPWGDSVLVFTTRAIVSIQANQKARIELDEIIGYEEPKSKVDVTGVRVLTRAGFQFVRTAGQGGAQNQHRDAYRLIMIIRALTSGPPVVS